MGGLLLPSAGAQCTSLHTSAVLIYNSDVIGGLGRQTVPRMHPVCLVMLEIPLLKGQPFGSSN